MLCLGGRLPDKQGAIITLDLSNAAAAPGGGAAADLTAWGEFHNGVAAGEHPAFQWNKLCSARHAMLCGGSDESNLQHCATQVQLKH